jgi:tetratricopeptide (TPR) repeat protein
VEIGSRDNWFRSPAWAAADREEFFARLARSKKNGAQHLRIKALALQQAALFDGALELLSRFLQEYPGHFDTAQALLQQAQCFAELGRLDEAEASFREALRHEQSHGSVKTLAWIEFPWFVVRQGRQHLYSEALSVLAAGEQGPVLPLPTLRYQSAATRAIICADRGEHSQARQFARTALEAAAATDSGLSYHGSIGLVENPDPVIHERIRLLAE